MRKLSPRLFQTTYWRLQAGNKTKKKNNNNYLTEINGVHECRWWVKAQSTVTCLSGSSAHISSLKLETQWKDVLTQVRVQVSHIFCTSTNDAITESDWGTLLTKAGRSILFLECAYYQESQHYCIYTPTLISLCFPLPLPLPFRDNSGCHCCKAGSPVKLWRVSVSFYCLCNRCAWQRFMGVWGWRVLFGKYKRMWQRKEFLVTALLTRWRCPFKIPSWPVVIQ